MNKCSITNCKKEGSIDTNGGKICIKHDKEFVYRNDNKKCGYCGQKPICEQSTVWCGECNKDFLNF